MPAHAFALARRRIAGTHPGADVHLRQSLCAQYFADAREGRFEIAMNVARQRFQRSDIDDLCLVLQRSRKSLADEVINGRQECGKRFARACWSGNEHVPASLDEGPCTSLCCRWGAKTPRKPFGDRWAEKGRCIHLSWDCCANMGASCLWFNAWVPDCMRISDSQQE
jgi:hypothetical protein